MKTKIRNMFIFSLILVLVLVIFQSINNKPEIHTNAEASNIAVKISDRMYSEEDNFAGVYIDENNIVNLNVLSLDSEIITEIKKEYKSYVKVNVVDNSYSTLKEVFDQIEYFVLNNEHYEMISISINEVENVVDFTTNAEFSETFLNEYLIKNSNLVRYQKVEIKNAPSTFA